MSAAAGSARAAITTECQNVTLLAPALMRRLRAIAFRQASRPDAEDALQELMIDVWLRGAHWHEGRIVLHLKSLLRNQRRADQARARREAQYAMLMDSTANEPPMGGADLWSGDREAGRQRPVVRNTKNAFSRPCGRRTRAASGFQGPEEGCRR